MSSFWILALLAIFLFLCYIYTRQFSYKKMPPGPPVFPIVGNLLSILALKPKFCFQDLINFKAYDYFNEGYKKHGPIFSITYGKYTAVVICSYDYLKEIENLDEYSIKISNEMTRERSMGGEYGLIFVATPELWMEMRKFSQRTLRDFGFGKRLSMQSVIEDEVTDMVKEIHEEITKSNGVIKIRTMFLLSVLNVLWCMIAGQRYKHDDPEFLKMLNANFAMTKAQTFVDPVVNGYPFLRDWFPKIFKYDFIRKVYQESHTYSKSLIDARRNQGIYKQEPENYIDCFLKKIEEQKKNPITFGSESIYSASHSYFESLTLFVSYPTVENNLIMMIEDFMQTGSTTTNGTLNYGLLYLMINPQVQKRCQAEIDSIVPRHLIPTLDDIEKMPYFQATILETHRLANVVPIPIPRTVPSDWKFRNFLIPKGTHIISNHYSIHMDEKYWKDPQNFRPERYINEHGEFVLDKHVIHFGFGKRNCIGVTLVNSVIPIYLATLLQNFNFNIVPGTESPTTDAELGVIISPKEYSTYVTPRA